MLFFLPKGLNFLGYQKIIEYDEVVTGFINTVKYTVLGTCINLIVCIPTAFALSRKELVGRKWLNLFFIFTMYFSGGLIPSYLVIDKLNMIDTTWALVLPGALNVYNMIVCRSFFQNNIPEELFEASKIDGVDYTLFFFKIVLPLSKAIIAVMVLYHALVHWNQYLNVLYYIRDRDKYSLQLVLRNLMEMFKAESTDGFAGMDAASMVEMQKANEAVRYAVIVVASIPVFLLYPLVQKYFVKGVMVGAVKG